MSTADFATFSDNAVMFASIVYVLAFLAHLAEWVQLRSLPVAAREAVPETVRVGASSGLPAPSAREAGGGSPAAPTDTVSRSAECCSGSSD